MKTPVQLIVVTGHLDGLEGYEKTLIYPFGEPSHSEDGRIEIFVGKSFKKQDRGKVKVNLYLGRTLSAFESLALGEALRHAATIASTIEREILIADVTKKGGK